MEKTKQNRMLGINYCEERRNCKNTSGFNSLFDCQETKSHNFIEVAGISEQRQSRQEIIQRNIGTAGHVSQEQVIRYILEQESEKTPFNYSIRKNQPQKQEVQTQQNLGGWLN